MTEKHFNTIKEIFQQIFKESSPLLTDLTCNNHVRRISAWLLLYMGDIQRYLAKTQDKNEIEGRKENAEMVEDSWKYYNRSKTIFPFEGKIYH